MDELDEKYGDIFSGILNKVNYDLHTNNTKYRKNLDEVVKLVEKYPNVRMVCEDKKPVALNVEEVQALINYYEYYENREIIQDKKLLYTGFKIAYIIFKNADMLKEDICFDGVL